MFIKLSMRRVKLLIQAAHVGQQGDQLDFAGRQLIEIAGYGDEFNHGMGHGIGLSVHELPAALWTKCSKY